MDPDRYRYWWRFESPEEHARNYFDGPWLFRWCLRRKDFLARPNRRERDAVLAQLTRRFREEAERCKQLNE